MKRSAASFVWLSAGAQHMWRPEFGVELVELAATAARRHVEAIIIVMLRGRDSQVSTCRGGRVR